MQRNSIRLASSVAALLLGATSAQADIVTATFTGTFVQTDANNVIANAIDTLGLFGAPNTDLTGKAINASFTYNTAALPLSASSPGSALYVGLNAGSVTETANSTTLTIGSNSNLDLSLQQAPDIFDLETRNVVPANIVVGNNYVQQYARIEYIGGSFLNGLGPVQNFTLPALGAVTGVDAFYAYTWNGTGYDVTSDILVFDGNLTVTSAATPEPAMLPVLGVGLAGLGVLCVRRRKSGLVSTNE